MRDKTVLIQAPRDDTYAEILRFFSQTLPPEHDLLPEIASMWSYALWNNGLTDKQKKRIRPILDILIRLEESENV